MSLKREMKAVEALSLQAELQEQRLVAIRKAAKSWKRQTFGRPESLLLAFIAGFAIAGKPGNRQSGEADGDKEEKSSGKSRALKAAEAAFLAWRLIGKPIVDSPEPPSAGTA